MQNFGRETIEKVDIEEVRILEDNIKAHLSIVVEILLRKLTMRK
jgi:hypothetical protein